MQSDSWKRVRNIAVLVSILLVPGLILVIQNIVYAQEQDVTQPGKGTVYTSRIIENHPKYKTQQHVNRTILKHILPSSHFSEDTWKIKQQQKGIKEPSHVSQDHSDGSRTNAKTGKKVQTDQVRHSEFSPLSDKSHTGAGAIQRGHLEFSDIDLNNIAESDTRKYIERKHLLAILQTTTTPLPLTTPVQCSLLFGGNEGEISRVTQKLKTSKDYDVPTDSDLYSATKNCEEFIKDGGYITDVLSEEEREFPLAFAIRMHYNSAQVEQLLRTIYRPQNTYCLYIDLKSPLIFHQAMQGIAKCLPNVFIASKLKRFTYASFSPVEADLQCMQDSMNTNVPWKYFINLAGSEFPLKTNLEIVRILKTLNGTNDVEQYTYPKFYKNRIQYKYRVYHDHILNTYYDKEPFDGNVTITKGCSYNSLSRAFVQWVLTDNLAQQFINWTKDIHSPDEVIWASLNSYPGVPGGYQTMVTQTSKTFLSREIIWYNSAAYCHAGYQVRGICILSVGDLNWLSYRWELFANKFDIKFDHYVLDCLEETLRNRTHNPDPDKNINWYGIYRAPHVLATPPPEIKKQNPGF